MRIDIKRLTPNAVIPTRGSEFAAGYDLYADTEEPTVIPPNATVFVGTGIAVAIPEGYFGGIYARSGLACKKGLRPANCVGVVDADYRGEVKVAIHNDSNEERVIDAKERIGQLVIQPFLEVEFNEKVELPETVRGEGGFGSTGTK